LAQPAIPVAAPAQPTAARQPQKVVKKAPPRKTLPPEDRRPQPGELICGDCGAGNAPTRKFCRRCGTSLVDAPVVKLHWWQRVVKPKQGKQAGYRRRVRRRRGPRLSGPIITLIILVILIGGGWYFTTTDWYQQVLDHVKGSKQVTPVCVDEPGSTSVAGQGPNLLTDGATNHFWAPNGSTIKDAYGAAVCTFASPQRMLTLRVYTGQSADDPAAFHQRERVIQLKVTVTNKAGKPATVQTITLSDNPGAQSFTVRASDATKVELQVTGITTTKSALPAALGEVEFLVRK
jgi:hypothetical protein